ncbi:DUF6390 family protein [Mycolicibacterium confluentis]|uniref:Uncharacterized protein n=1 Tax=Mycolicibacterium confluentis TaxID=28047 RepID=A0A7I7XYV4_9MYCO|nr:DUF6390 family protein [Mycolicibacterium confluentis]MCV7319504.1 hypothetical protein [Mycolicibacterium confluentis]ORV34134.1 hypothetical protein AWB99_00295 [Mycolicibacterium confluentis]BBZ34525.1 hypothetical protein MCNF_31300 [Mycolicibacterium confluentis]
MTADTRSPPRGWQLFASYAYPPNELGYCGPPDSGILLSDDAGAEIAAHARGFDGAWPYLEEIAAAAGISDPLDADVVRSYWLGTAGLPRVDGTRLVQHLRRALRGQPTGLLDHPDLDRHACADHSFHVFAVYPWVRFLSAGSGPSTPVRILQSCRIRWGTVESVDDDQVVLRSRPLLFTKGALTLGPAVPESVRWARGTMSLTARPRTGDTVSAHWDWVCARLDGAECDALAAATATTLRTVNLLLPDAR